jgi:hypothetical protein
VGRLPRRVRKLGPEAGRFLAALLRYRSNPFSAARRYWSLYGDRRFSPDEINYCHLLDPSLTPTELAKFVSKEELLDVQCRLNPPAMHVLTADKVRFHEHCVKAGLPVPRLYAVYDRDQHAPADLERFLADLLSDACILKPVAGLHGDGVTRLRRAAGGWNSGKGVIAAWEIAQRIEKSSYRRWMLQELISAHPRLCALSDVDGLQTIRAVTVVHRDGKVEILVALLKLLCRDAAYDNFGYGRTGNVIANLDLGNGAIHSAVGGGAKGRYAVTRHPRTDRDLIGFRVPGWNDVAKLAHDAAKAFMPLRTIGWDIAVTPGEPCLIEGNVTWDPPSGNPCMGEIYRSLQALASRGS